MTMRIRDTEIPRPEVSLAGEKAIGPSSPVQKSLVVLRDFLALEPTPDIGTSSSRSSGLLVGNHLFQMLSACGLLNGSGLHSAAVTVLRPLEDALDCFAAVTLVTGAAERWGARNLKPSDAAKMWTQAAGDMFQTATMTIGEYRKTLRGQFAHYSHCSYDLCLWDLFFSPRARNPATGQLQGPYELNKWGRVVDSNAHAIDAHLTAHHLECIAVVKRAYSQELSRKEADSQELDRLEHEIIQIMERHNEHQCQNVFVPPEWRRGNPV